LRRIRISVQIVFHILWIVSHSALLWRIGKLDSNLTFTSQLLNNCRPCPSSDASVFLESLFALPEQFKSVSFLEPDHGMDL
jgi:hypothetical protein